MQRQLGFEELASSLLLSLPITYWAATSSLQRVYHLQQEVYHSAASAQVSCRLV